MGDSRYFFGREALTEWLVSDLRPTPMGKENRFLAIVGASGSGKSSLARAGLLAQLRQGAIEGSADWPQVIFKPGEKPLESLAIAVVGPLELDRDRRGMSGFIDALPKDPRTLHLQTSLALRKNPAGRLIILADQFEEVFTLCKDEAIRQAFIANLLYAATVVGGQAIVVLTLRADFLGKCAGYSDLAAALSDHQELVGPMTDDELLLAIERPALLAGGEFESGLVETLRDDVKAQPGGLPLLQHALFELWQRREGRRLPHRAYEEIGRVEGALAKRADAVYGALQEEEKAIVRRVLLRLIQPGEGTEDTRRRTALNEVITSPQEAPLIEGVIKSLADVRLLVTEGDTVDVAHEALIRGWPQLRQWIDEDRSALLEHRRVTAAAEEWQRLNRDESALYQGLRLAQALVWRKENEADLNALERDFLDAGLALRQRQEEEQRRRARRQRWLTWASVAGFIFATVFALVAWIGWNTAQKQTAIAEDQKREAVAGKLAIAAKEAAQSKLDLALLLGVEAVNVKPTAETRSALLSTLLAQPDLIGFLHGYQDEAVSLALSSDGHKLAAGYADGTIQLWDVAKHQRLGESLKVDQGRQRGGVAFSTDGQTLAIGSSDGAIRLWDVEKHQLQGEPLQGHLGGKVSGVFNPKDGRQLAAISGDGVIRLWDLTTRQPPKPSADQQGEFSCFAFSPNGQMLAVCNKKDKSIQLWDAATPQPLEKLLARYGGEFVSAVFSSDGQRLAAGSGDGTIWLWDMATHQPLGEPLTIGRKEAVLWLAFGGSGNSQTLVSNSSNGTIQWWDVTTRQRLGELTGQRGGFWSFAFDPDGQWLAAISKEGRIRLWTIGMHQPFGEQLLPASQTAIINVVFSPDGQILTAGDHNGMIRRWDMKTHQLLGDWLAGAYGGKERIALSPNGQMMAEGDGIYEMTRLWDVTTHQPLGEPLKGQMGLVPAFSQDGRLLAVDAPMNGTIQLWDIATHQRLGEPLTGLGMWSNPAFSRDGRLLATGGNDGMIRLWDVATRQPAGEPIKVDQGHQLGRIAFSPDGRALAVAAGDKTIRLWDVAKHQPLGEPLTGHKEPVKSLAFSPDGQMLASGSEDGEIRLWDVMTCQPLGGSLASHQRNVMSLAFNPGSQTLASGHGDGTVWLWDVAAVSWQKRACAIAGRNLALGEWRYYIRNEDYRKTCPEWPEGK